MIRLLLPLLLSLSFSSMLHASMPPADVSSPEQIDLTPLDKVAVWQDGRLKSFQSFARSLMQHVTGPRLVNGQPATFTCLDIAFRPGAYEDVPVIYVKKKPVRSAIINAALGSGSITPSESTAFMETGLLRPSLLRDPAVSRQLDAMRTDVLRFARSVDEITTAMSLLEPGVIRRQLFIIPPMTASFDDPWQTMDTYEATFRRTDPTAAGMDTYITQWRDLASAWSGGDTATVNRAVSNLGNWIPSMGRSVFTDYPSEDRLKFESMYFRLKSFTWVWMVYLLSIILLLMGIAYKWKGAKWLGLGVFGIAFLLQTLALALRWYVAGRWPNTNMFEAVTTSTWFGGCFAILMEILLRRTRARTLFALAAATASMFALMAASFNPLHLSPHITNRMPVLHDVWLYIHTNVIIFSYVLIFLASVSAGLYLLLRCWRWMKGERGIVEHVGTGGVGSLIIRRRGQTAALLDERTSFGAVLDGTTMILVEISFILLWAGLVMGAIWADHSWGRPWGWDPKEVFALNTFLIYAILVHTRMKARDKGLWTAVLAVIGCIVMLFNWIVINFTISGLHSYA